MRERAWETAMNNGTGHNPHLCFVKTSKNSKERVSPKAASTVCTMLRRQNKGISNILVRKFSKTFACGSDNSLTMLSDRVTTIKW